MNTLAHPLRDITSTELVSCFICLFIVMVGARIVSALFVEWIVRLIPREVKPTPMPDFGEFGDKLGQAFRAMQLSTVVQSLHGGQKIHAALTAHFTYCECFVEDGVIANSTLSVKDGDPVVSVADFVFLAGKGDMDSICTQCNFERIRSMQMDISLTRPDGGSADGDRPAKGRDKR